MTPQGMTMQALVAIAAHGGYFYDALDLRWTIHGGDPETLVERTRGMSLQNAACATREMAHVMQAFFIEECDNGYRLCRFSNEHTGHAYSGELFPDAQSMWAAMRTLADMAEHPACKVKK